MTTDVELGPPINDRPWENAPQKYRAIEHERDWPAVPAQHLH